MRTFEAYSGDELKGTVRAENSTDAIVIAGELYSCGITAVHEVVGDKPALVPMSEQSKEYFLTLVKSYFDKKGLDEVAWNLLSKRDLYNVYVWAYNEQ
jgi:hypothetical protein